MITLTKCRLQKFSKILLYDAFYSNLRSCNSFETKFRDNGNLLKNGLTTEQAAIKLTLSSPPPAGKENYQYLQHLWKQEQMNSFTSFLRRYNNKNVLPTLEAMQKVIDSYQDKDIHMIKPGCTLRDLANICVDNSTDTKFYPSTSGAKDFSEKLHESIVGGTCIVFARKAVNNELFNWKSTKLCKPFLGIDARQIYPNSMSQTIPSAPYTLWVLEAETGRLPPGQNKPRRFENMINPCFERTRPECKVENLNTSGRQKKIKNFNVNWFFSLERWVRSNDLLLSLLSLSRSSSTSHWIRLSTR